MPTAQFYNGTIGADIDGPKKNGHKCSIHHWGEHGIGGRGVLVDYWTYAQKNGIKYDPFKYHAISYSELKKAAQTQGLDLRPEAQGGDIKIGDILIIRSGWVNAYDTASPDVRQRVALRGFDHDALQEGTDENSQTYAGMSSEDDVVDFLHDSYFAAVAGDAPAFEAWPTRRADGRYLHEFILALWGESAISFRGRVTCGISDVCREIMRVCRYSHSDVRHVDVLKRLLVAKPSMELGLLARTSHVGIFTALPPRNISAQ